MKKIINRIFKFIVRWENRNTFCLIQVGFARVEWLKYLSNRGITIIFCEGLEGDKIKIIRLGKDYQPQKIKVRKKKLRG